jgi:hypothetical protein
MGKQRRKMIGEKGEGKKSKIITNGKKRDLKKWKRVECT